MVWWLEGRAVGKVEVGWPGGRVLARLDVANARLIRLASDPNVFRGYHGTLPDGSVIATLGGFHEFPRLVRISADGKASTTLFPK